ncbi:acetyl-CoA carboxylase biotin carboxyl carrier protein [Lacibacterium aquatile]|uniref:Biotin carboxyl carrier protein of acetyl-CoA carboxylase n=1 Tax=Lacibacterium aquatile TaxID=1168082 RepID=A0ABW5DR10_9PROT
MSQHDLELELIRNLAGLLDETKLTEIEFERDKVRIRVARTPGAVSVAAPVAMAAPVAAPAPVAAAPAVGLPTSDPASHPGAVTSPMVGTVYHAPDPNSPAFIKVGDKVTQGQTLLIIEAMKVMNPFASPRSGTVKDIIVRDSQPVEFGEVLLIIE